MSFPAFLPSFLPRCPVLFGQQVYIYYMYVYMRCPQPRHAAQPLAPCGRKPALAQTFDPTTHPFPARCAAAASRVLQQPGWPQRIRFSRGAAAGPVRGVPAGPICRTGRPAACVPDGRPHAMLPCRFVWHSAVSTLLPGVPAVTATVPRPPPFVVYSQSLAPPYGLCNTVIVACHFLQCTPPLLPSRAHPRPLLGPGMPAEWGILCKHACSLAAFALGLMFCPVLPQEAEALAVAGMVGRLVSLARTTPKVATASRAMASRGTINRATGATMTSRPMQPRRVGRVATVRDVLLL